MSVTEKMKKKKKKEQKDWSCSNSSRLIVGIYPRGTLYESLYCGLGTEQDLWGQIRPNGEKGSTGSGKWHCTGVYKKGPFVIAN